MQSDDEVERIISKTPTSDKTIQNRIMDLSADYQREEYYVQLRICFAS